VSAEAFPSLSLSFTDTNTLSVSPPSPPFSCILGRGKIYLWDYFGCIFLQVKLRAVPHAKQENNSSIVHSRIHRED